MEELSVPSKSKSSPALVELLSVPFKTIVSRVSVPIKATVPLLFCIVTVRSAVGSVTVRVVS